MAKSNTSNTKVPHYIEKDDLYITPAGRMTFVALARKWKKKGTSDENLQYALTLIFQPGTDLTLLKTAADEVCKEEHKVPLLGPKRGKGIKTPFLDAAEKDVVIAVEGQEDPMDLTGWIMIRANGKKRRPVVRNSANVILEVEEIEEEAYAGRWARMMIRPAAYDVEGKGIKFYLEGVQLLRHDEKIGQGSGATDGEAFGAVDEDDDGGEAVDPLA